ncbi:MULTISPECIES: hypothetical protein [unclassified Bradyrhizobium]|uniref:hypothetical protein n=1 Tax=unclassified Bradyrhizobium TaxID=2631580 RepID=UPI0015CE5302|nr:MULTISPECIES: hypothetical protein [unclassified Bradyrhizobium]MBB4256035.1 hypothetical protein [Bradyrhizobium sp. CIR3A]NYG48203.1 hypothetical protein [Bradyrhizobium sp. IAR9]
MAKFGLAQIWSSDRGTPEVTWRRTRRRGQYYDQSISMSALPASAGAREIRNRLGHDFGPTQLDHIRQHAPRLIPIMIKFIHNDITPVLEQLRILWTTSNARP